MKKTSDLLVVMSNLFTLRHGTLVMNPERTFPTMPLVKLGDPDFTKVRGIIKSKKKLEGAVGLGEICPWDVYAIGQQGQGNVLIVYISRVFR